MLREAFGDRETTRAKGAEAAKRAAKLTWTRTARELGDAIKAMGLPTPTDGPDLEIKAPPPIITMPPGNNPWKVRKDAPPRAEVTAENVANIDQCRYRERCRPCSAIKCLNIDLEPRFGARAVIPNGHGEPMKEYRVTMGNCLKCLAETGEHPRDRVAPTWRSEAMNRS